MKRYLQFWLILTGTMLLAVAACNLVADPYGLFRLVDEPGFNRIKPSAGAHGTMAKAYQVLRVQPRGLILGNSRAEVGFDPEYEAWPADSRPVFNLALPGTGTETTVRFLQHVLANDNAGSKVVPKVVVWGIDFMDFLIDARTSRRIAVTSKEGNRLLTNLDGSPNPTRALQQARDYLESTLTLGAFIDAIETLGHQGDPYAVDLTPLGFNPMRDYLKITADEGYWAVFRQRDLENVKAYLRRPKDIFDADGHSSPRLDDLRRVLSLCRQHGIALHLIIYPYHSHLMEIIRITGHWPTFEDWKRAITHIVGTEAGRRGEPPVLLWDFSGFDELTTEAVPGKNDRQARMHWYWEAGHFKRELGNLILDRIFTLADAGDQFGTLLRPENVEAQIALLRAQEAEYRKSHPRDVAELESIAEQIKFRRRDLRNH
ncbi:hypothetical protein [Methylocaldum gracile]|jgi:hypothetical protein|uniref:hypothetical protein n=1 Tax=Methylocaldum sp. 0917 TaxID=2485163 RepID=UPI00105C21E3